MKKILIVAIASLLALAGCNTQQQADKGTNTEDVVAQGDSVVVEYTLTWPDGTVISTNTDEEVTKTSSFIESKVSDTVIAGDEKSLLGAVLLDAKIGSDLEGILSHEELGFDDSHDKYRLQKVPLKLFTINNGRIPTAGDEYTSDDQSGLVVAVNEDAEFVTVDFNPRYTYQDISYSVKVVSLDSGE